MKKNFDKKAVVLTIVLIFLLSSLSPAIGEQVLKNENRDSSENTDFSKGKWESLIDYFTKKIGRDEYRINSNQLSSDNQINVMNPNLDLKRDNQDPIPLDIDDVWWNPNWEYRKEITINHSKVDASLSDFPVLVSLSSDSDLANDLKCQNDGDDIAFADKNGNQLFHEIELFNCSTGKLDAWVKVPSLSSTVNTTIYLYYGNPSASNHQDKTNVWDNDFTLVQHLNETSGTHFDSTSYDNNGTANNGLNQTGIGLIDGADTFDAIDDYIDCGSDSSLEPGTGDFTFEAWVKRLSTGAHHCIVCKRASTGVGYIWWIQNTNIMRFYAKPVGGTIDFHAGIISDSNWHHVAVTLDRDSVATVYVDGSSVDTEDISEDTGSISSTKFLAIGRQMRDDSSSLTFDGTIDEVRVSQSVRNSSWIKTEYNNQLNPDEFFTINSEEQQPAIPIVSDPSPEDSAVDVSISLSKLSFSLSHKAGSSMNYSVETSPDVGSDSDTGVGNGTYNCTVSGITYDTTYSWYVNVTDGSNSVNKTYTFTTVQTPMPWWNTKWAYRKQITIDHTKINGDLSGFPVLININSDTDLADDTKCQNDGDDIVFTNETGVKLNHEIELFDGTTGELICWVNADISSSNDTILFLYYGNPGADNQENVNNVWDSNYMMVHHLQESSGIHCDSTNNFNNGTPEGSLNQDATGIIDGADDFDWDDDDDYINCGNNSILNPGTGDYTIELWAKRLSTGEWHFMVCKRDGSNGCGLWMEDTENWIRFYALPAGNTIDLQGGVITDNNWHHIAVTLDRDGNGVVYLDGSPAVTQDISTKTGAITSSQLFAIGRSVHSSTSWGTYNGTLDEVRISNIPRSSDWISTSYNNQFSPDTFYDIGIEEVTSAPVIYNPIPVHKATNIPISITNLFFSLSDLESDPISYLVETSPDVGSGSDSNVGNGTYSISVSGLAYNTSYNWYVNVTDGTHEVNNTFIFSTKLENQPPSVSNPSPINGATGVPLSTILAIDVEDIDNDLMNITFKTNATGSWQNIGTNLSVNNGTYMQKYTFSDYNTKYWWSVHVYDGSLWTNRTFTLSTEPVWLDNSWPFRKLITIDYTKIPTDFSDFPFLIEITDSDLASKAQSDGDDILFTDYSGNKYDHEIEFYNNDNGHLISWVNIKSLSSSLDTLLYMYYGNSDCNSQENAEGVWDSNFKLVQHLEETSGTHYDSTNNDNDGSPQNGVNQTGVGQIDGADTFDAIDDYINCGTDSSLEPGTGDFTFEAWIKRLETGTHHAIMSKRAYVGVGYAFWIEDEDVLRFYANPGGDSINLQSGTITDNNWHHVVVTLDRDGNAVLYLDTSPVLTQDISSKTGSITSGQLFAFGAQYMTGVGSPFNGSIDEVRVSNVVRSSDWITLCYNNHKNPTTYISISSEEISGIPVIYNPIPADGAIDIPITLSNLSFSIKDYQGNLLNYSVETIPNIGSDYANGVGNGTYNVSISSTSPNTLHTWFVNVTDGINEMKKIYTFTTQDFPPTFTASAYNRTVINLTSISGQSGTDSIMIRYKEFDSSQGWPYKKQLTINNSNEGYQMPIRIYKNDGYDDPANGTIDCEGHCNDDFSDIRFLNIDEDSELPYWIENKTDGEFANVWLKTNGESDIYVLYGYTNADSTSNGTATFEFFEDFSRSKAELEATGLWYQCGGSCYTNNGILYWTGGPGGVFHTTHQPFKYNMTFRFRAYLKDDQEPDENGQSCAAFDPMFPESGGTNHYFVMLGSWYPNLPKYQTCFGGGGHVPNIPGVGYDCKLFSTGWPYWQTYEITRLHNQTYARNVDAGEELNSTLVIPRDCNLGVTSCTIKYGMESEADWFLLRKYTPNEPTWSNVGIEEASCNYPVSQYPANITDGILLMNSTVSSYDHTGLSFGAAYCYSAWAYNITYKVWSSKFDRVAVTHANKIPTLSNEYPPNNMIGVNPEISSVSIDIYDAEGDLMDWIIDISSGDSTNGSGAIDGTISCALSSSLDYLTTYDWIVNVSDGYDWINKEYMFTTGPRPAPWWNSGWDYRKYIMIDHTKVEASSSLINFPVLISFDTDSDLSSNVQSDADDIVFTDYSSNKLNHEIEYYNNTDGQLIAWVNISSLSSTEDTIIYLYYGNSTCSSQENVEGVWDSNFKMVQHLEETSSTHYDSTSYNNDGTPQNGINQDALGLIDGADSFDANDDYIDCGNNENLNPGTGDYTIEGWIKRQTTGSDHAIASKRASYPGRGYFLWIQSSDSLRMYMEDNLGNSANIVGGTITCCNWHHVAVSLDRDGNGIIYIDGNPVTTQDITSLTGSINSTKLLAIGRQVRDDSSCCTFDGPIDEFRISDVARSEEWISTCYNNQYSPITFYRSIGSEEIIPQNPLIYDVYPSSGKLDVQITLSKLSFTLVDYQNNLMNYTVETVPDIGSDTANNVVNGAYNTSISGLEYNMSYTWYLNVTDGVHWTNKTYHFSVQTYPGPWWNKNWPFRKPIIIMHENVIDTLNNFPILIRIIDSNLASKSNGIDIAFASYKGIKLDHEIEYYNDTNGELVAWIKVPTLSSNQNTVIYIYYGTSSSGQENPAGTWSDNYAIVHHLDETSGDHYDSTQNSNDGEISGAIDQNIDGIIDGADYFAGTSGLINIPADSSHNLPNELTISMWIKPGQDYPTSKWAILLNRQQPEADNSYIFGINDDGKLHFGSSGGNIQSTKNTWEADTWTYVSGTYRSDLSGELYIDGVLEPLSVDNFDSMSSVNRNIEIGGAPGWATGDYFMGIIDEVHLSNIARNSSWVATEYNNQYDPESFSYICREESSVSPIIANPSPADGTVNVPITLSKLQFDLFDVSGDLMDYYVETSPDIGSGSASSVSNGTYNISISGLTFSSTYKWFVNATDLLGSGIWTNVTFIFSTASNLPVISNIKPDDRATGIVTNPTLEAEITDFQGDTVDWWIRSNSTGVWTTLNNGSLLNGNGTISSSTSNMAEEGTKYYWSVNITDPPGSGDWVNETYKFTTFSFPDKLSFATFTDTHIGSRIQYPSWGIADNLDLIGQDITSLISFCKFAINLGDITNHNTAHVHGIGLPGNADQYKNNLKAFHISHLNLPFYGVIGNHDVNDYELNDDDPHNLTKSIRDELSMNSPVYAMMRDGILFLTIPELGYVMWTHPVLYEWVEYMTSLYPNTTTIIFSHQAIEDTTAGGSGGYRGKGDMDFWSSLFQNNSQIKMWIHGHNHMLSWYLNDQSTGSTHPVYYFGHDIAFSAPYSQTDWGNYHEEDRIVIYNITEDGITTKAWDHNGATGQWVSEYDHTFTIDTTYNTDAEDWYSFPVLLQDNETQLFDMKVLSPDIEVQLIGTSPMELFYDEKMESPNGWANEVILGFADDRDGNVEWTNPGMKVWGPKTVTFPEKYPHSANHEDGRSGQPYQWVQMGTISAAIPGQTYNYTITAKSTSGSGNIRLVASCTDWGTRSQYSTLSGSSAEVFNHTFGSTYETYSGTYTVPNDSDAWFLQGDLEFIDDTTYEVELFSVKRVRSTDITNDFHLFISGQWYNSSGPLAQGSMVNFTVDPRELSDSEGIMNFTAFIDGNQYGMARLIYHEPILLSRNARFRVNDITDVYNITLTERISRNSTTFKMFPFNYNYNNLQITASDASGVKHYADNGRTWVTCNTPSSELDVEVTYGYFTPVISNEQPSNGAINVKLNPMLKADVRDLQSDSISWWIRSNSGGTWADLNSGTLPSGNGTISTTTSNMNSYSTLYQWSVNVTDPSGSSEWTNRTYYFTTRPENYAPIVSNPSPGNDEIDVPLTTALSVSVSDGDGEAMDIKFMTNATGSWQEIGTNDTVGNGTYQQTYTFSNYNTTYWWSVNVTDGKTLVTKIYSFKTDLEPGVWYNDNWFYRKEIEIDHTKIPADLSNFPLLIELTDSDVGTKAQSDGDDIFFTDYYARNLDHEIEYYDNDTGHLIVWVNIDDLSSTKDTVLYIYYGNLLCDNQENIDDVWPSGFKMVHHLSETSGLHYDSSSFGNDGTTQSAVNQDAQGTIDGADEFDGTSNSFIDVGTDSSMDVFGPNSDFSIFLWVKRDDTSNLDSFFSSGSTSSNGIFFGTKYDDSDDLRFMSPGSTVDFYSDSNVIDDNEWHHIGLTADRDGYIIFWVDSIPVASQDISLRESENWNRVDDTYKVGTDRSENNPMDGLLDEVKLYHSSVLSSDWIETEYNNQLNPSSFYSVGSEQFVGNRGISLFNESPSNNAVGIPVGTVVLSISVSDPEGDLMNITFMTNATGSWQVTESNNSVGNGTYQQSYDFNEYNKKYWWSVNATDPDGSGKWSNQSYCFTTLEPLSDWSYRKKIKVDHTNIDQDLTNFPLLIQISNDNDLVTLAQDDFDDILFTNESVSWASGSITERLHHEIEDHNSTTGNLTVWVNVTFIDSLQDTILYMYYGNPTCENMQNPTGVWLTGYVIVHHLDETSGTHFDSTVNDNDGTCFGGVDQNATGVVDGADSFDGSDDYVRIPDDSSIQFGDGSFTAEVWIYPGSVPEAGGARVINNRGTGAGGSYKGWQLKIADSTGKWKFKDAAIDDGGGSYYDYEGTPTYDYNDWYHVVMVYEADNELRFYVNGNLDGSLTVGSYGSITNSLPTAIAAAIANNGVEGTYSQHFDGIIDETRLSNVVRNAAWIKASYLNQVDPSSFYGFYLYPEPKVTLVAPLDNASKFTPVNFTYIPEGFSPGNCKRAELWFNVTERYNGSLTFNASSSPQRGVIKNQKLYVLEGGIITIREFPNGTIIRQGSTFGASHTNTAPVVVGDVVYGMNTAGRMQAYNETTGSAMWTRTICSAMQANSMELHNGYLYVVSTDFVLKKVDISNGTVVANFSLDYTGSNTEKAHPLIDYENDRLYALGDSKYHCIDLNTFTEIWNISIVTSGGRDTRAGPILVNDSYSGQYLTIFATFPQTYTYAVTYDGSVAWTWTTKTIRAHAAYNPNTGLIYLADATGYSDTGASLPEPGNIYGVYVNNGTTKWVTHGTGGGDKFARPITTSGNYIIWKTDNSGKDDYLYIADATTGETLSKISAGDDRGYWCFPCALSGGYVATGGGYTHNGATPILDIYHIGDGDFVDSYPLHSNVNHTGYVENGLTSLGFLTETWESRKINETPIINNTINGIKYDFTDYSLPENFTWNIKLIQSDGQYAWGDSRSVRVLPINQPPIISNPIPVNNATNVPLSLSQLSVFISDPEGNGINWSIETSPDIGSNSGTYDSNGTKTCSISGLQYDKTNTWFVNATDVGSGVWTNVSYQFTTPQKLSKWPYRKEIVINHLLVHSNLINFPVVIEINDDIDLSSNTQDDFDDILFTNDSISWYTSYTDDKLSHEIENYDSSDGNLTVWVNVTSLSSTTDTKLYMYYGNPSCGDQQDVEGTWNDNFALVHHLNEDSGLHYDSTINSNDGTCSGGVNQDTFGMIDGADDFDGSDDLIDIPAHTSHDLYDELTISLWIKPGQVYDSSLTDYVVLLNRQQPEVDDSYLLAINSDGRLHLGSSGGNIQSTHNSWGADTWYHVVGTYRSTLTGELYINGSQETLSVNNYDSMSSVDRNIEIGGVVGYGDFFDGIIDEIRILNKALSSGWVSTEYNNQYDPSNFYNIGGEESINKPIISNPSPSDGASNILVLISKLEFTLTDTQGDTMNYWVETSPNIGSDSATGVGNGTYNITVSGVSYNTLYTWYVNVTDPLGSGEWVNETYTFTTEQAPAGWWDEDWYYRKMITIDHTQIDANLSFFPVLIDLIDVDISSKAQSDGDDFVFTDYFGNKLNHEIELYNNSNGHLIAWVNVTSLSSTEDTILYLYYGNSNCVNQENIPGVWRSEYVIVQHLDETSGTHYDSTIFGNNGTCYGSMDQDASGKIDGADEFDGANDYIDIGTDTSMDIYGSGNDFSIFLWIKRDDTSNNEGYYSSGSSSTQGIYLGSRFDDTDNLRFMSISNTVDLFSNNDPIGDNDWHLVGITADRDGDMNLWADGISVASEDISSHSGENWNRQGDTYKIGTDRSESSPMDGIADEVRAYNGLLSEGWISTEYNNQYDPASFYSISGEETILDEPVLSNPSPINDAVDVQLSPTLLISANDSQGDLMNIIFRTNATGSWQTIGTNSSVGNGTYYCSNTGSMNSYNTKYWWSVNATDPSGSGNWTNITFSFTTLTEPGLWWNNNWMYRRKIVIDHSKIAGDLDNFTILIDITDANISNEAQSDGDDFVFTDFYATKLDHEIELYNSSNGELISWVKVPFLSGSVDTILYLYYGNQVTSNMENIPGSWDENYMLIQHLNETSGLHYDSTIYVNDGTANNSINQDALGMIDGADDFDGSDDYVRMSNDPSLQFGEGSFTAMAWIYPESVPDTGGARVVNNRGTGAGGSNKGWQFKIASSAGKWKFKDSSIDDGGGSYYAYEGTPTYDYNDWYHVVMVYEADNELRFYVNGNLDGSLTVGSYGNITNNLPTAIGGSIAHNGVEGADNKQFFDGIIDEVRLSNVNRSVDWLSTNYNNQYDPSSFYSVGGVEESPEEEDTISPEITNVDANPDPQIVGSYVNITCAVTDNVEVNVVKVDITYPDSSTENLTMDGSYFKNKTYSQTGLYSYFIWASDTSGNSNISDVYYFYIYDPSMMYVDDDFTSSTPGWGYDHFDDIQDGIDNVSSYGMVSVFAGFYNKDLIVSVLKTGIELVGEDKNTTVIKGVQELDWPTHSPAISILASGVKIHGFTIESPDYSRTDGNPHSSGISVGSSDVEIFDNRFNATDDGTGNSLGWATLIESYGAWAGDISGLYIHNNTFTSDTGTDKGSEGIYINYNSDIPNPVGTITIENNVFGGQLFRGITSEHSKTIIAGNTIGSSYPPNPAFNAALRGIDVSSPSANLNPNHYNVSIIDNNVIGYWQGIKLGGTDNDLDNITIEQNILQLNTYGAKAYSSADGIVINYNKIVNNTLFGVENADTGNQLDAAYNWWGNASGPGGEGPGTGDNVSVNVDYAPWYVDEGMTTLSDNIAPEISDVTLTMSDPIDTNPTYGWENITCTVTDDNDVDEVNLNVTYPDSHTENISMIPAGGGVYYHNTTFSNVGTYSYFIWAADTSGNSNMSSVDTFVIPPNYDINMDGHIFLQDFAKVSLKYGQTGPNGWIREDVNNDGEVFLQDFIQISLHYDETWP